MKKLSIAFSLLFTFYSCVNLDEVVYDEVQVGDIEALLENPDPAFLDNLVAAIYAELIPNFTERNFFNLQESTTDIAITPVRFREDGVTSDWFDGGRYVRLHTHAWDPSDVTVNDVWGYLQGGIAAALEVLTAFNTTTARTNEIITPKRAEVQGLLAMYMSYIFDLYAQVPYINIETNENVVLRGNEAIDEMLRLLEAAMPNLLDKAGSNSGGKFSKAAAQILLARLHLNKAVYNDRYASSYSFDADDMKKVVEHCTELIDNGGYTLSKEYFSMFDGNSDANAGTDELIFVVNCIAGMNGCNRAFTAMVMSQGQFAADAGSYRGWNGFATTPEFVDTWDTEDPRYYKENFPNEPGLIDPADYQLNRGIQVGTQHGPVPVDVDGIPTEGGAFKRNDDGLLIIEELKNFLRDNLPINYTKEISGGLTESNQFAGARVFKYEYDTPGPGRWDTDINPVLMRLAEAYLMRAEAKLRMGDEAGALQDVNAVRSARGAAELSSIDEAGLLEELGFEFYWESHRRTDMIRFGQYNKAWTEKPETQPNVRVFPIPTNALAASSKLEQNMGY